jgi:dCMP deaminase
MKKNIIIAFVPAIHVGYINLFKKYKGSLYILGKDFIADFPHIERDIRTPEIEDIKKICSSLELFDVVEELTRDSLQNLNKDDVNIVMPDDEITRAIAEKYLQGIDVTFDSVFLRWNRVISTNDTVVPEGRVVSTSDLDKELINVAGEEAEKSSDWWRQIGSLVVKDGKIILSAHNKHLPSDFNLDTYGDPRSSFDAGIRIDLSTAIHSEASLVAEAAKRGLSLNGCSFYVSTFPCPNCAKLLVESGIKKVYYSQGYSLLDAEDIMKAFGVEIILVK